MIYAEGNIVGGKNSQKEIGQDIYRYLIRKARLDKDVKAIVLRINSGGGSALVSENLWRELTLAESSQTGSDQFWRCFGFRRLLFIL